MTNENKAHGRLVKFKHPKARTQPKNHPWGAARALGGISNDKVKPNDDNSHSLPPHGEPLQESRTNCDHKVRQEISTKG